jgi:hypothetical protein
MDKWLPSGSYKTVLMLGQSGSLPMWLQK